MSDVVLVQMPYGAVERPSIALGLLKAYARRAELGVDVVYGNLLFAEEVGLDVYRLVDAAPPAHLLGEWTFSEAAFPDFEADHEEYLRIAGSSATGPLWEQVERQHPGVDRHRLAFALRREATAFVDAMARTVLTRSPRIVGCTSMFQQHCASLALLRRIRELAPEVVTMLGGANCEGAMGRCAHEAFPWVDFIASGEADGYFGSLCRRIVERGPGLPLHELPEGVWGPAHRGRGAGAPEGSGSAAPGGGSNGDSPDGEAANGGPPDTVRALGGLRVLGDAAPPRAIVHDLDETAVPDYDEYFATLGSLEVSAWIEPSLVIETSRGCWWGMRNHCTFCGLNGAGMTYRSKSPERVVSEVRELIDRYGLTSFQAADNILDMSHVETVLPELEAMEEEVSIFYEVKANLKRRHLERFAAAGVRAIQPGIESMDARPLEMMKKGNDALINVQLLKWSQELDIAVYWNFLVEIPGEEDAWYLEMVDWLPAICHLEPPTGIGKLRFDRFSPYHEHPERYGLRLRPYRSYGHVYPLPPEGLADLAYYFESEQEAAGGRPLSQIETERPGLARLEKAIAGWQRLWAGKGPTGERPVLSMRDDGETLRLCDTRPLAERQEHRLSGLARAVYRTLDRRLPARNLLARLRKRVDASLDWSDVEPILDDLVERRLILALESGYLALATDEAVSGASPRRERLPFGRIHYWRAVRELAPRSLAARSISPREVPLEALFGA